MGPCDFEALLTKARPHIFEKICLSLNYETFKNCLEVNTAWRGVLTTKTFQKKAKAVFKEEILKDEKKLIEASDYDDTERLQKLLSSGLVDVNCVNPVGRTPLFQAIWRGHNAVVRLLLDNGADPNKADIQGVQKFVLQL